MWMYFRIKHLLIIFVVLAAVFGFWLGTKDIDINQEKNDVIAKATIGAPLFNYFGNYHKSVVTKSVLAQRYFTQGLILYYGFNFEESIRSFKEVTKIDPHCAMGYWGLALALGTKTNALGNGKERREAIYAIQKAQSLSASSTPLDKAYIEAMAKRFQNKFDSKVMMQNRNRLDCPMCRYKAIVSLEESRAYSNAMKKVVEQFPSDIDAKNLYTASLFDAADWQLFDKEGMLNSDALEIIASIESVFKLDPRSQPAHHYYIHAMELSSTPEKALSSADYLRSTHHALRQFAHMPAHIYLLTGRYHDATVANQRAIAAYKDYIGESWAQGFEPKKNPLFLHDLYSLYMSSVLQGRSHLAIDTAEELLRQSPYFYSGMGNLEMFYAVPYFAKLQFGLWNEILDENKPLDSIYQTAMWYYARGLSFLNLMQLEHADNELNNLISHRDAAYSSDKISHHGKLQIDIAVLLLQAEVLRTKGHHLEMQLAYENALKIDHGHRDNSSLWHFPIREALADAYLKIQQPIKAEEEYKKVLLQYPENGWSLFGLSRSLSMQGKIQEAASVHERFRKAWARADVTLPLQ